MRQLHASFLSLLVAAAGSTGLAHAQVKFADFSAGPNANSTSRDISFQDAREKADLRHGTLVSLQLNNDTKVVGHVVRFDAKDNRLFVRARPGEAPVAYEDKDIKKMEKATRPIDPIMRAGFSSDGWRDLQPGLQENANGVLRIKPAKETVIMPAALERRDDNQIKPAIDESAARGQNVVEPEITKQVFYNGNQRTVIYLSNVISPGEREILEHLQRAENDLTALAQQRELRDAAIAQELSINEERVKTQRLINVVMRNESLVNYPYLNAVPNAAGFAPANNYKGIVTLLPQTIPPAVGLVDRLPPVDPQAYTKAREDWQRLQSQAIYEDGRLVAVVAK